MSPGLYLGSIRFISRSGLCSRDERLDLVRPGGVDPHRREPRGITQLSGHLVGTRLVVVGQDQLLQPLALRVTLLRDHRDRFTDATDTNL